MSTDRQAELDRLLADLGAARPEVPDALMARILADAAAVQDDAVAPRPAPVPAVPRLSIWAQLAAAVGGGRVVAGLGSAAVAGVVLGFAQPAPLSSLTAAVWGQGAELSVDLVPSADDLLAEG